MRKRIISVLLLLSVAFLLPGCDNDNAGQETTISSAGAETSTNNNAGGQAMGFQFEALQDGDLINGSSYFMDFGAMNSQEDAAIAEGKLLTAFGEPEFTSENYENSFNYIIRVTSKEGESVVLAVYGMGVVHIGSVRQDDFAKSAAAALIAYVDSFAPADYSRTVYYLDFDLQLDIQVKNGEATVQQSQISEEKADELFDQWYSQGLDE